MAGLGGSLALVRALESIFLPMDLDFEFIETWENKYELYGCELVAVPELKPDGRGAWLTTTRVDIVARPKT